MRHRTRRTLGRLAPVAAALLLCPGLGARAEAQRQAGNPYRLSPEAAALAAELARAALSERDLDTGERLYLVATQVVRDKESEEAGEPSRFALVTHYRYEGDLTIRTRVDLARRRVVSVETLTGVPTALSREEFERAKELALADAKIAAAVGERGDRVEIEPLVIQTVSEDDPLFGHRAVRLLFKTPRGYLRRPIVIVDLTAGRVIVESPPSEEPPAYPGTEELKR